MLSPHFTIADLRNHFLLKAKESFHFVISIGLRNTFASQDQLLKYQIVDFSLTVKHFRYFKSNAYSLKEFYIFALQLSSTTRHQVVIAFSIHILKIII